MLVPVVDCREWVSLSIDEWRAEYLPVGSVASSGHDLDKLVVKSRFPTSGWLEIPMNRFDYDAQDCAIAIVLNAEFVVLRIAFVLEFMVNKTCLCKVGRVSFSPTFSALAPPPRLTGMTMSRLPFPG